jgi:phosphatidylglycerophosphate synthase
MNTSNHDSTARRPIAARSTAWAPAIARLAISVGLTPNQVSFLSVIASLIAAVLLGASSHVDSDAQRIIMLIGAGVAIQMRLLCNLIDGLMAVEGNMKSPIGAIYNDLPDRVSDAMTMIAAGYAASAWPWALELGWLAALLAVLTAYVRVLGASAGPNVGHDFRGPMAKQHRMAIITIACALSIAEPWLAWHNGAMLFAALAIIVLGCCITIVRRTRGVLAKLETS